ncbi:alpha/beta hydrolase [Specibacter cremeus]|uniref:alpha/beta hydrolase n=1 Tax=Specibacter cremeus TaxID=1629051 RepID=UPI000F79BFA8|nr:alpha/beta hydrolase [Specibacter cremeus]
MNFIDRVDPQLRPGVDFLLTRTPPRTTAELAAFRRENSARVVDPPENLAAVVVVADHVAPGRAGTADVALRSYTPARGRGPWPCVYWLHGGGMIAGSVAEDDQYCMRLAESTGAVVVSVEYRLAPEHPFPAALDDAYNGLLWTAANTGVLGIDPDRLAIGGASAGGGIAAGTALMARDRHGPALRFQYLLYPMLDDRQTTHSSHEFTGIPSWNRERNEMGWQCLLGGDHGTGRVSPYAAPARAADLSGLPPAMIQVGELDLFRDEDIDYAARLLRARVPTELSVYAGVYHGSDGLNPEAAVTARMVRDRDEAIIRALG